MKLWLKLRKKVPLKNVSPAKYKKGYLLKKIFIEAKDIINDNTILERNKKPYNIGKVSQGFTTKTLK